MTFAQKVRQVTISMLALLAIAVVVMITCYKLGILLWLGACIAIEIIVLIILDRKEEKKARLHDYDNQST